uniref:Uncharacterized protein n=1 Tax=Romanomermis culicivorax TaxID=13658 RepID=A0A915K740_ROMCU
MRTSSTSSISTTDEPPLYRKLINISECYVQWAKQQPHQNDLSFCCDENDIKRIIRPTDLESGYVSLYTRPPNVLPPLIFLSPSSLGQDLAAQPTPNFCGFTLVGFHTQSIMAADMKNFQFAMPMPANSTASSYPCYVQLAFPIFETFAATLEDWTALFSLVDSEHTIIISFNGADDWAGINTLLGTQFRTDRQKKNKDPIVKAIHFDAYLVIRNIDISPLLYELARQIRFFPEKLTLKSTVSTMWALDVSKLMLKFPAALRFFNNPATSFLQSDVLPYAALDTYYPLLLFLAFGCYGFIPESLSHYLSNHPPCDYGRRGSFHI